MDSLAELRIRYILIAAAAIVVLAIVATRLLPRKARIALYVILILGATGVWAYVTLNRDPLRSDYAVELAVSGLIQPTYAAAPPDGSGRLFVTGRTGLVQVVENGSVLPAPLLNISEEVASEGGEQGLLSLVFHPDFETNGYFYLYYSALPDFRTVLSRFQVSEDDPNVAPAESETVLLEIPQPNTHHNGGDLEFGPDGYLYLSVGDGGQEGWPGSAQDTSNLLGAMLRLDVSEPAADPSYRIPDDNPYANSGNGLPEIWAIGLRNPWRFDFDPQSGDLYLTDVGAQKREEVNYQPAGQGAGANYGWKYYEGDSEVRVPDDAAARSTFTFPVHDYDHLALGGCAIVGGFVYRGEALPGWEIRLWRLLLGLHLVIGNARRQGQGGEAVAGRECAPGFVC
jgi:glucose/arabinose dehydrogenase